MAGRIKQLVFIVLVMFTVNLILFVAFPLYVIRDNPVTADTGSMDDFHALKVLDMPAPRQEEKEEKKMSPEEDKPQPEKREKHVMPRRVDMQDQPVKHRPTELDIDSLNLEMNFRLNSGVKVSAPPAPPEPEKKTVQSFDGQFGLSEVDTPPVATSKAPPVYPYRAKRLDLGGKVKVKFLVARDGTVSQVEIISAQPGEMFNQSVIRAVSGWRFKPAKIKGHAVDTWMVTTIVFNINAK